MQVQFLTRLLAAALLPAFAALPAHALTVWDEATDGDLSSVALDPTPLLVADGENKVLGSVGNAGSGVDRDYFSFVVPTGYLLSSITLLDASVSGSSSFIALQAGPQVTVTPSGAGIEALLGYAHYGNDLVGQNLLEHILLAGHTAPLAAGTYSIWVQETGGPASYALDLHLTAAPVPEPGTWAMSLAGLAGWAVLRRRRATGR